MFGLGNIVCCCNVLYCDIVEFIEFLMFGSFVLYMFNSNGSWLVKSVGSFFKFIVGGKMLVFVYLFLFCVYDLLFLRNVICF